MPRVSVIMGVYNGSKGIKAAIESILNQTFTDFELIVCDDGSTDNSVEIIEELAEKDNRIKLLKNTENIKLSATLNRCLKESSGEYIARMDDDDISHPERFEKQVLFLDTHPLYCIVGTGRNLYDDNGFWGQNICEGERKKLDIYLGKTFVHPSVMMKRSSVLKVNGYTDSNEVGRTEDYDLWCKLYEIGCKGYNTGEVLLDYYEARDSYSKRKYRYRIYEYRLKKKWRKRLGLSWVYSVFAYRPLIVGLFPRTVLMKYHAFKYR